MKPELWEQINDLFQSAVERAPEDRAAFLEEACRGDEALWREVKSLIACYEPDRVLSNLPLSRLLPNFWLMPALERWWENRSVITGSSLLLVSAEWARCISRVTSDSGAKSRSSFSQSS